MSCAWFEAGMSAETLGGGAAAHTAHDPRQVGDIAEVGDLSGTVPSFGDQQVKMIDPEVDRVVSGQPGAFSSS